MPCTAWKHTERNRQRDRKKYVMISGGFVIPAVQNNSLNDSRQHSLEPTQILSKRPYCCCYCFCHVLIMLCSSVCVNKSQTLSYFQKSSIMYCQNKTSQGHSKTEVEGEYRLIQNMSLLYLLQNLNGRKKHQNSSKTSKTTG